MRYPFGLSLWAALDGRRTACASPTGSSRRRCGPGASGSGCRAPPTSTSAGTACSIAAWIVQRPSPESSTWPVNSLRSGSSASAIAVRSSSQDDDDAAAPPDLGDVGEIELVAAVFRHRRRIDVAQDVEALGEGLHHPVLDAVVDHLDEMAGAGRPAIEVALLDAGIAPLRGPALRRSCRGPAPAPRRSGRDARRPPGRRRSSCNSRARGPRRRRWCRHRDSGCPSPSASRHGATSSWKKRVAAVDQDVAGFEQTGELDDRAHG